MAQVTSQHIFNLYMASSLFDVDREQIRVEHPVWTVTYDTEEQNLKESSEKYIAETEARFGPIKRTDTSSITFFCDLSQKENDIVERDGKCYLVHSITYVSPKEAYEMEEDDDIFVDPGYYAQARLVEVWR